MSIKIRDVLSLRFGITLLLFSVLISLFFPINPVFVGEGLDQSWSAVLTWAFENNIAFGRDVIFTYGPLGVFRFPYYSYSPNSYYFALFFSSLLIVCLTLTLSNLSKRVSVLSFLVLSFAFIECIFIGDFMFWSYFPYLYVTIFLLDKHGKKNWINLSLILFFTSFSILLKISHLPVAVISFVLLDIYCLYKEGVKSSIHSILLFIVLILTYMLIGQNLMDFPDYLIGSIRTMSGFSESMQLSGSYSVILRYIGLSIIYTGFTCYLLWKQRKVKDVVFFVVSLLSLFISFKAGFVRHDAHSNQAVAGMCFVVALSGFYFKPEFKLGKIGKMVFPIILILTIIQAVDVKALNSSHRSIQKIFLGQILRVMENLKDLPKVFNSTRKSELDGKFVKNYREISKSIDLSGVDGSVDIYPYDQVLVIANNLDFRPRPLFQSYSAYNPYLIKRNIDFLNSERSADNILLSIKTIDNRISTSMEGASWKDIKALYEFAGMRGEFALLKKRNKKSSYKLIKKKVMKVHFDDVVNLPDGINFIKINIKKNLVGRIVDIVFKLPMSHIRYSLSDRVEDENKRLVPEISREGFFIDPFIENTTDFIMFLEGKEPIRKVNKFSLSTRYSFGYQDNIVLEMFELVWL